jgi:hypothetical protein
MLSLGENSEGGDNSTHEKNGRIRTESVRANDKDIQKNEEDLLKKQMVEFNHI